MAEDAPQKEETKILSMGKPERLNVSFDNENVLPNKNEEVVTGDVENTIIADAEVKDDKKNQPIEFNEDHFKAMLESQGIKYEGLDKLKEKINFTPQSQPTEDQVKEQAKASEKKLLDLFISGGGTAEQYVAIKNLADADLAELSLSALKKELKDAKFSDEEIAGMIKESYYQIDDEELEQYDEESDKDFLKRKKEYGAKKLANHSSYTKIQAQKALADLKQAAESEDLQAQEELSISANIDEQFKTLPRKEKIEIGEINGKPIPPVDYEISDTALAEVKDTLKDPAKRQQFLYNTDGSLNLTNLTKVLTRNIYLESAVKAAYHEGGSRQVAAFQKTFPATTPHELGVGGSSSKPAAQKGQPASYGKPQRVSLQHN